ncbi:MAG: D-tyrosyl-tRNA(Tyr) deacylase [Erysipelotrichaceae bacterium]|nr:D-tyrosyl-tRNA(Tyr) deacylase [Erysipelotrichaceae bacterium]
MRLVIQKVSEASCTVEGKITGQIENGYMVLVGIGLDDNEEIAEKMALKLSKLRIFDDEQGKINLSIYDVKGKILSISQFTLYADCRKGNRPSFTDALGGERALELYRYFNECLRKLDLEVEEGIFGAEMKIALVNEGPITIVLDSEELW